jgi:hypothetical protein
MAIIKKLNQVDGYKQLCTRLLDYWIMTVADRSRIIAVYVPSTDRVLCVRA